MKDGCSSFYKKTKESIISQYSCFKKYFEDVEEMIRKDPYASSEETILYEGKARHVRKRYVRTTFFSGLLPDIYKYLTITYGIAKDGRVIFLFATMHDYID